MTIASPSGSRAIISMRPQGLRFGSSSITTSAAASVATPGVHRGPEAAAGRRQMAAWSRIARPRGVPRQGRTRRRGWIRHPTRGRRRGRASRRRSAASARGRWSEAGFGWRGRPRVEDRGRRDPTCASSARRWLARVSALAASGRGGAVRSRGDPDQLGSVRAAATPAPAGAARTGGARAPALHPLAPSLASQRAGSAKASLSARRSAERSGCVAARRSRRELHEAQEEAVAPVTAR
jgi:hypothetical protein